MVARSSRWSWRVGVAKERLGHADAALAVYQAVIDTADVAMSQYFKVASLYEQRGDHTTARDTLQVALERAPTKAEYHVRLARLRARDADWGGAITEYGTALEIGGERADWLAALARAYRHVNDYHSSVDAYQRAIACAPTPVALRHELAMQHDQAGSWAEAASVLTDNVSAHPWHAVSFRQLALVNEKLWRWNGQFEQRPDGSARFVPLAGSETDGTQGPARAQDAHAVARQAMARGASINDDRPNWLIDLGRMHADAGDHHESRKTLERAYRIAIKSVSRQVQASIHPAQFGLELAYQRCGAGRVSDPLFDLDLQVSVGADQEATAERAGVFDARAEHDGLRITGLLSKGAAERVELWLDDLLLRRVNLSEGSHLCSFQFRIRRSALQYFPSRAVLTVRTEGGEPLHARGRSPELMLSVPGGTGKLADATGSGRVIDKKGVLAPSEQDLQKLQDDFLKVYAEVREFLEREFGKQLLLFYGNLLGLYRDGGFIPGDDDFDVGYVSDEADPVQVKAEAVRVMTALMRAGFTVSVNRKGALFRVQRNDMDVHLSVRQAWFKDGKAWILRYANFPATRGDFLPAQESLLRGTKVLIPAQPEVFLAGHYGPGWRFPDPGFRYYSANVSAKSLNYLHKARMTPAEFRKLDTAMSAERKRSPAVGRLVALGAQSLYPLESYIE